MTTPGIPSHDVLIVGGGLAGLTLALQLRRRMPDIDVVVLERRIHPVPHAAHKVGESSVEIGAHYFDTVLGLKQHMQQAQLRKFGFRFFFSEGRRDIQNVTELGASGYLSTPSYQIDRGIFENYLALQATSLGVPFVDDAVVHGISMGAEGKPHVVEWQRAGERRQSSGKWLIDASGRAALLKRKLALAQPNAHDVHAVWFRISSRITLDDWSDDAAWQARCEPKARWLSTNHLCGAGYWVWLIPLASGSHSVGIVADSKLHPLECMDSFEKSMRWLSQYQPRLYEALADRQDQVQDFRFLSKFSYGCKTVFSADRWALTGEAGLFLDPFYSPGSDFIAMSNTFVCDLVERERSGRAIAARAQVYDRLYHSFYDSMLTLYQDQYPLFGDAQVLPVKVIWDYTYYWAVLSQVFFQGRLTDLASMAGVQQELGHCQELNAAMQRFLREWSQETDKRDRGGFLDQAKLDWFAKLNASLTVPCADAQDFCRRIRHGFQLLCTLAWQIRSRAGALYPQVSNHCLNELLNQHLHCVLRGPEQDSMLFPLSESGAQG